MAGSALSDYAEIVMGQSPPGETCNTTGEGLPLLNGPTEYGSHHPAPLQFTTDARKRAKPGDVLFCVRGSTTGRMNWADREYAIGRGVAAIRHKGRGDLQPFVRAVIEYGLAGLLAQATGSTFPNVSADQLAGIWWPPLDVDEQRAIARILGTLDDKIELNRRMSETLEAMARALFKSWFVDFDPVRLPAGRQAPGPKARLGVWFVYALECEDGSIYIGHTENLERRFEEHSKGKGADWTKRHPPKRVAYWEEVPTQGVAIEREKKLKTGSGREWLKTEIAKRDLTSGGLPQPPCLPARQVADLFPARLVDSELGEIPEGWEVGSFGDVATHPRRGVQPDEIEPDTPYIALEHMPKRCIALSDWGTADGLESNKFEFQRGEVLFGKLRPYFHKVGVAPVDGVCSTDIVVVAPRNGQWFGFVLGHLSSIEFVEYTDAASTGTKMPRTSWTDMARYELVLPPEPVAAAFTEVIQPSLDRIIAGIHESRTLAALRDALLPKLISGDLRLKNAALFVHEGVR